MKHKTAELSGVQLDAAVAKVERRPYALHTLSRSGVEFLTVYEPASVAWVPWSPSRFLIAMGHGQRHLHDIPDAHLGSLLTLVSKAIAVFKVAVTMVMVAVQANGRELSVQQSHQTVVLVASQT
jgi:hypothetical protein